MINGTYVPIVRDNRHADQTGIDSFLVMTKRESVLFSQIRRAADWLTESLAAKDDGAREQLLLKARRGLLSEP